MKNSWQPSTHRHHRSAFTLLEMMITLAVLMLLTASVFGMVTVVLQSTSRLQDNQNHRDQLSALRDFLGNRLRGLSAQSTLISYRRDNEDGLDLSGIAFGQFGQVEVIDAKVQANGYYTLRLGVYSSPDNITSTTAALPIPTGNLEAAFTWTPLVKDVRHMKWKFEDRVTTQWADVWSNPLDKPNLIECTVQLAGDSQSTTMDFWLPQLIVMPVGTPNQTNTPSPHAP